MRIGTIDTITEIICKMIHLGHPPSSIERQYNNRGSYRWVIWTTHRDVIPVTKCLYRGVPAVEEDDMERARR